MKPMCFKPNVMMSERKGKTWQRGEGAVANPDAAPPQEGGGRSGLLTRFLKWIAKGAIQSRMNKPFCPT
jgi:hypothetical protein